MVDNVFVSMVMSFRVRPHPSFAARRRVRLQRAKLGDEPSVGYNLGVCVWGL